MATAPLREAGLAEKIQEMVSPSLTWRPGASASRSPPLLTMPMLMRPWSLAAMVVAAVAAVRLPLPGLLKVTASVSGPSRALSSVMAKVRNCLPGAGKDKVPSVSAPLRV